MLSEYDVKNIHQIMANRSNDWFSAKLLRLIAGASGEVRGRFCDSFPAHVELVGWWYRHRAGDPAPVHLIDCY